MKFASSLHNKTLVVPNIGIFRSQIKAKNSKWKNLDTNPKRESTHESRKQNKNKQIHMVLFFIVVSPTWSNVEHGLVD